MREDPRMYTLRQSLLVLGLFHLGLVLSASTERFTSGSAELKSKSSEGLQKVYHGLISEDAQEGDEVELDSEMLARDRTALVGDKICGYTIYKSHSELPFKVVLQNRDTGRAKIVLAPGYQLNYERRHRYNFEVAPHDCESGKHAVREQVHIEVRDVNEFAPRVERDSYLVEVAEGQLFDEILQLRAEDKDGSTDYSTICHYHILTPDVPFKIDSDGVLYNTEPLDYSKKHNFILEVRVEDCGGPQHSRTSDKVMINVKVKEACKVGWKGVNERIEYAPGSQQMALGQTASLETCDNKCVESQVSARVHLTTKHIGKGCDRDTYSIQSQRKLCGASTDSIDLLPSPALSSWTRNLPTDDGQEQDQIFAFDGHTNAIEVPSSKFNHTLTSHFTVATWMKHEQDLEDDTKKGRKHHILCNSDGEKMNRHHYSLYVHNCRLIFLLRQEPLGNDLNVFNPAEWRWKIPQVCDGQWHHYAISIDFPQVRLYLDGKLFVSGKNNPEIIDDWPLHPSKQIHYTRLVVGACWQGGSSKSNGVQKLEHFFKGYLAGLNVVPGKTETDRVLKCLNNCKEKLEFHAMSEMQTGMSVAFNSEMTEITINGRNRTEVEHLVQRIGYINTRSFPTPGHRALTIQTDLTCEGGRRVQVPDINTLIIVLQAERPIITLAGSDNLARTEHEVSLGEKIFRDITISSETRKEREEIEPNDKTLNDCSEEDESEGEPHTPRLSKRPSLASHFKTAALKLPRVMDTAAKQLLREKSGKFAVPADEQQTFDKSNSATAEQYHLDSCIVRTDPPMNVETEYLRLPDRLMEQLGLEGSHSAEGAIIAGADKIYNYEMVLRQMHYINTKPEDMNSRIFTLTCSELNGRFVSNEFKVKVDVIHTIHHQSVPQAHVLKNVESLQKFDTLQSNPNNANMMKHHANASGVGVTVIVVVCVGFLLFMIVLGVIRIRAAHQRSQGVAEEKPEMEWDNSALTITVNPMDQEAVYEDDHEVNVLRPEDSDTEDDEDASSFHDELESSEEESEKVKDRELEWDDSTLTF